MIHTLQQYVETDFPATYYGFMNVGRLADVMGLRPGTVLSVRDEFNVDCIAAVTQSNGFLKIRIGDIKIHETDDNALLPYCREIVRRTAEYRAARTHLPLARHSPEMESAAELCLAYVRKCFPER